MRSTSPSTPETLWRNLGGRGRCGSSRTLRPWRGRRWAERRRARDRQQRSSWVPRAVRCFPSPYLLPTTFSKSTSRWASRSSATSRPCTLSRTPSRSTASRLGSGTRTSARSARGSSSAPRTVSTRSKARLLPRHWAARRVVGRKRCSRSCVMGQEHQSCSNSPATPHRRNCACIPLQLACRPQLHGRRSRGSTTPRCRLRPPPRSSTSLISSLIRLPRNRISPCSLAQLPHLHRPRPSPSPWSSRSGTGCSCTPSVLLLLLARATRSSGTRPFHW